MTWRILAEHPVVLLGAEHPLVASDPEQLRAWFSNSLRKGPPRTASLLWRRNVGALVLDVARRSHGARTGQVVSKSDAASVAIEVVSTRHRRVLRDSLGFRHGAHTSMYWGPVERRSHAKGAARELTLIGLAS
jgi:hypothetical protein